ncbi:hypothetical protein ABK040_002448 [Willaertia magna]
MSINEQLIKIKKKEVNKILTEKWNILNKDYPTIKLGKSHRTRPKEMENIKEIKNIILETLDSITTFIFFHKINSLVFQFEKTKDNVDFNIFKRMHIERILELQDCLVLNGGYKQSLSDYIIHLQEKGFDLNENNFNTFIHKIYRVNMIDNKLLYNQ